jgi:oligopeptidase B
MHTPPSAEQRAHVHTDLGVERPDPFHWIKDRTDPATIAHLEAENAFTAASMAHTDVLRGQLYEEMLGRIQEDDTSAPVQRGAYWYYRRTVSGQAYPIHCRKKDTLEAPEEILLDENALAEGQEYLSVSSLTVSPDHRRVAWLQDNDGAERFRLRIKDLTTGEMLPHEVTGLKWSLAWGDSETIFYTRADKAQRPFQIWRHDALAPPDEDVLVFEEPDEVFFLGVGRTRDEQYVVLQISSKVTTELQVVPTATPKASPQVIWARREGVEASMASGHGRLYFCTNLEAQNFRLLSVPAADPGATPREDLPHDPAVFLKDIDAFAGHLVFWQRENGLPRLTVRQLSDGQTHTIDFPDPSYDLEPSSNPVYDTDAFRFAYTSPVQPDAVISYNLRSREQTIIKQKPIRGGYDRSGFVCRRLWATAPDGERVPITIAHRADLTPDSTHPTLLIGYGSYGFSYPAYFSSARLSLLERGVVLAIGHIRGGSEMGRHWYENGKFFEKKNTFSDFIACAEHLIASGWSAPDRLAINGGSAGGLLMGAVINARPELFRAVVAQVPFVDALNTMLDASLPLTVTEYEEWGNPNKREVFDYLRSYSPYDNITAQDYPAMLVTGGLNDPRVGYWEPAKWVAALRLHKTDDHLLLLKTHMGAGHGGKSGRYGRLEDTSWVFGFVLDQLGVSSE